MATSDNPEQRPPPMDEPERRAEIDRLIKETRRAIENTRNFLKGISASQETSKKYIEELTDHLRWDLEHLSRLAGRKPQTAEVDDDPGE